MDPLILLVIGVAALVAVVFILIQTWGRLLRKVGPNQALIVYGAVPGGTKVITGGSKFVVPLYQRAQEFSLELMSFDVAPAQDLYTSQGVAVNVEAVTQIKQANASREAAVAKSAADQERVKAEAESLGLQAESQRNLALKKAAFDAEVKKQQATADKTYDIQANLMQQQVVTESVKVTEVEKNAQIKVQQAEIQRRELELQATIQKAAEAERRRVETVAGAERQRLILEAQGQADAAKERGIGDAEANKARGLAEAEVIRARGLAEAEVIRAKGEAEADAMKVKAAAFHEYNQAAVLDKLLTGMPEIVRAIAEPLSKVDKVTIISTGTGGESNGGLGASRLTGDIVN